MESVGPAARDRRNRLILGRRWTLTIQAGLFETLHTPNKRQHRHSCHERQPFFSRQRRTPRCRALVKERCSPRSPAAGVSAHSARRVRRQRREPTFTRWLVYTGTARGQMTRCPHSAPTPSDAGPRRPRTPGLGSHAASRGAPGRHRRRFHHDCARPAGASRAAGRAAQEFVPARRAVVRAHRVVGHDQGALRKTAGCGTLDRSRLWATETPQVFARDLIRALRPRPCARQARHRRCGGGRGPGAARGAARESPPKSQASQFPADLAYLEFLLTTAGLTEGNLPCPFELGHGYDIHRIVPGVRWSSAECGSRRTSGSKAIATPIA